MMYYHFMCSLWFNCLSEKLLGIFGYSEVCWFCLQFIQIGKVVNDVNVLTRIKNYMKPYPKWKLNSQNSLQLKTPLVWRPEVPTKWISARPPTRELKPSNCRAVCNLRSCVPGSPEAYVLWYPGFGQRRRWTGLVRPFPEFDPRGKNQ